MAIIAVSAASQTPAMEFMAGADISALAELEDHGAVYKDGGQPGDAIGMFRDHGTNWFRLRLFVNPTGNGVVVNDLDYTIALAQRVKASGAKLLLDFHYSDTWADPGHQTKPAAWNNLNFNSLVTQVHDYTRDAISDMKNAGVLPDMVQIGNEIASGMLWSDGYLWTGGSNNAGFDNLATLLDAGISGAKEGAGPGQEPLIMIHHDRGDNWGITSYFFDKLADRNVDFDVIGYSYYPRYHYNPANGSGGIADVAETFSNTADAYGKPVVLVETGFASRGAQYEPISDFEFDVTPQGQADFLQALVNVVQDVPNDLGAGVFWWYPEALSVGNVNGENVWEGGRLGLFDPNGNLLPAASVFDQFLPSGLVGDYNGNNILDAADYSVWRDAITTGSPLENDSNGNGIADAGDFDYWRAHFGETLGSGAGSGSSAAAVPEPTVWILSGLALAGLLPLRRRQSPSTKRRLVG